MREDFPVMLRKETAPSNPMMKALGEYHMYRLGQLADPLQQLERAVRADPCHAEEHYQKYLKEVHRHDETEKKEKERPKPEPEPEPWHIDLLDLNRHT